MLLKPKSKPGCPVSKKNDKNFEVFRCSVAQWLGLAGTKTRTKVIKNNIKYAENIQEIGYLINNTCIKDEHVDVRL